LRADCLLLTEQNKASTKRKSSLTPFAWILPVQKGGAHPGGERFWKGFPNMCYTVRESLFGCRRQQSEGKMRETPPIIQDGILTYQLDGQAAQVMVDSADWYGWLETASTFTFRSESGSFTAHKERAGNRRGRSYWRAYCTRQGQLQRIYLGQPEALTLPRLQSVAARLFGMRGGETLLAVQAQDLEAVPRPPAASSAQARLRRGPNPSFHKPAEPQETASEGESGAPWRSTLPVPLTSLFGREREVAAVAALLRHTSVRLVTLTGTGGVGKTRLALHVAAEGGDTFADGVCFVSLAPISDPGQVMPAIAKALGLWEALDRPLLDQVRDYLREQHLLLLLDNFEQVAAAAPQLAALLVSCPRLHLLVTSRAALHLSGESAFPVPPLPTPDLAQLEDAQALAQVAAVRLFVERAHAIQPAFGLTRANARTIAEICVRLDGLPLAIELAAARVKLLPPQALLHRLSHRFDLLTGGARDLPARQQTLRNTLQWSYDLLTSEEQRLFRWLSIFVGGCTLEAAETVCQAGQEDGVQTFRVLEGVTSLMDKSLVQQTEQEGEEPRLVLLETIREFGLDRLHAHGEWEAAREAHAAYSLHLAEEAYRHLFGGEAMHWFERVEHAYANLRAALEWALEDEQEETGSVPRLEIAVQLVSVLWRFWNIRGYMSEGRAFVERVLARSEQCREPVRLKALTAAAMFGWYQEDAAWEERLCEELLPLSQRLADRQAQGIALFGQAAVALLQGRDPGRAHVLAEQAQAAFRAQGETWMAAFVCLLLARVCNVQGEAAWSRHHLEEGLALYRRLGYAGDIAWPLIYLARQAMKLGEQTRARTLLQEAIGLCQQVGYKWGLAHALGFLGQLTLEQGDLVSACALLTESLRLKQEMSNRHSVANSLFHLASALVVQGDIAQARTLYEQSLAVATELGHWRLMASCLQGLAVVLTAQAHLLAAARLWGAAETLLQNSITTLPLVLRVRAERTQAMARTQLGELVFAQEKEEGRTMTPEQILGAQEAAALSPAPETRRSSAASVPLTRKFRTSPDELTPRELDVLRLLAQGLTSAQIAQQLVISLVTVNSHVRSIYSKLEVSSRSAATRYAMEHHLL
jgi:predicted ATPase/DNA-binding CsgD family transcriptional regulator